MYLGSKFNANVNANSVDQLSRIQKNNIDNTFIVTTRKLLI